MRWATAQGHTVFIVSWVNPDAAFAQKSFDDYLRDGPLAALAAIEKATGGSALGLALSLGTQATLTVTDTPDTRSWTTLPARMALTRMHVAAGKHAITIKARGDQVVRSAQVKAGGWAAVNFTDLR